LIGILDAAILGLVQGLSEWLPISSSAHLALAQYFLGISAPVAFDVMLHIGTVVSVLAFYRNELFLLAKSAIKFEKTAIDFAINVAICAIPTAIIGFAFRKSFESMYSQPALIAAALAINGIMLLLVSRRPEGKTPIGGKEALAIGIAQGIAVAPGISRSGATISAALIGGAPRADAMRFSFLAGIIPILGAAFLEAKDAPLGAISPLPAAVGIIVSAIAGYASIMLLSDMLKKSKFSLFGIYCLLLAGLVFLALFARGGL
jgi:undecaprenyl-diphosphatase